MRIKLDENLGKRGLKLLQETGHDVATVASQELCSSTDRDLIQMCRKENRCLVTLDVGFSNPLVFVPLEYCGIVVLRLPGKPTAQDLDEVLETLVGAIKGQDLKGQLWIVQRGRVRQYDAHR